MTTKKVEIEVRTFEGMTDQELRRATAGIMTDKITSDMAGVERTAEEEAVTVYELSTIKDILYSRKKAAENKDDKQENK